MSPLIPPSGNPRLWKAGLTVQEELECKLSIILQESIKILACGRTDRNVHACQQVITCDTDSLKSLVQIKRSLNAILCQGLAVQHLLWVTPTFHPRFSACSRTYHYYIWPQAPARSCFLGNRCWLLQENLNLESMRRAAQALLGRHNFSAYTRAPEPGQSMMRELKSLDIFPLKSAATAGPWADLGRLLCLEVCANAFLRRMVRQLVANLVEVGRGRWSEERPAQILETGNANLSAPPAPAHGLFFIKADYGATKPDQAISHE